MESRELTPIDPDRWDRRTAAHLAERTAFGATPSEIEALHALGPELAVDHVLDFSAAEASAAPDWVDDDSPLRARAQRRRAGYDSMTREEQVTFSQTRQGRERARMRQNAQWWLGRMTDSPAPLQEKLALFWHGHFATQGSAIRNGYFLYRQNRTFRERAVGPLPDLLHDMCRDPALLRYLDNDGNRKEHPNENFARELLELFTLGEGNYSERDVKETARAFTGWTIGRERVEFRFAPERHDDGPKEILGEAGPFDGDDVARLLARHPGTHRFLARKLWVFFASPDPDPAIVDALAEDLAAADGDLRVPLRTMFLSRAFHSDDVVGRQVKSPAQWLVGTLRRLGAPLPPPEWTLGTMSELGQELFEPPNVAGWPGGREWIGAATLLARYRRVDRVLLDPSYRLRIDVEALFPETSLASREAAFDALAVRFFPLGLAPADRAELAARLDDLPPAGEWHEGHLRQALVRLLASPHYQLA